MHVFNFDKKLMEIAERAQDKAFDSFLRIEKNCCHNRDPPATATVTTAGTRLTRFMQRPSGRRTPWCVTAL